MGFRVNHLHFKTPDPRKTADFYVEFAGAKIVSERKVPTDGKLFAWICTGCRSTSPTICRSKSWSSITA
jgi:catechol 2,3-dioxygenase-like lactoylglutathione lyase family enzyme